MAVFSYFAFSYLAPWQLGKDGRIVARNHQIEAAYKSDPVPVDQVVDANGAIPNDKEWTRVSMQGHYLSDDEVLLRLRNVNGQPSFQSLFPFQLDNGKTMLVHRGWVEAANGTTVPHIDRAPSNEVTVDGMMRKNEDVVDKQPIDDQGYRNVYSINTQQIGQLTGTKLGTDYVMLNENQPGVLTAMPIPQLDRGNHLSYGLQWLAFGVMAPAGLIYFVYAEYRERRRMQEEQAEMAEVTAAPAGPAPEPRRSRSVRDRYGEEKPDFYAKLDEKDRERF